MTSANCRTRINLVSLFPVEHTGEKYSASLLKNVQVEILDLNDYELPLYGQDKEEEIGHPQLAKDFLAKIAGSYGILIAFAEHNGSYTVAYKNIYRLIKSP